MRPLHRYEAAHGRGAVLFASDLHLSPQHPQGLDELRRLVARTGAADALYLLGDIFEYWVGDDDLLEPFHEAVAEALHDAACPVWLMHGNRDFLLGHAFEAATHATLLPDPTLIDLYGTPTVLLHGDALCTDDVGYQRFRAVVRRGWVQRLFLRLPHGWRRRFAGYTRQRSRALQSQQPMTRLDVTPHAAEALLRETGATRLLHGHTHRPARHSLTVDGRDCERWVLADWYGVGTALRVTPEGAETLRLSAED
ncbi:MAG: UDP-2,3-diacylglucosamine diphosphatase [Rhodocyclaceae bacterium]|nr:UDP-2,3-diacylglucosamine diphosphatase [Rhodocyclaceae bacterium]